MRKRSALHGADIVFVDADNGVGVETEKHPTFSEIRLLRRPGRAIALHHVSRPKRDAFNGARLGPVQTPTPPGGLDRDGERVMTEVIAGLALNLR